MFHPCRQPCSLSLIITNRALVAAFITCVTWLASAVLLCVTRYNLPKKSGDDKILSSFIPRLLKIPHSFQSFELLSEMPLTGDHQKQTLEGRYISEEKLQQLLRKLFGENYECEVSKSDLNSASSPWPFTNRIIKRSMMDFTSSLSLDC